MSVNTFTYSFNQPRLQLSNVDNPSITIRAQRGTGGDLLTYNFSASAQQSGNQIVFIGTNDYADITLSFNKNELIRNNISSIPINVWVNRVGGQKEQEQILNLPVEFLDIIIGQGELNNFIIEIQPNTITRNITEFIDVYITPPPFNSDYWEVINSNGGQNSIKIGLDLNPFVAYGGTELGLRFEFDELNRNDKQSIRLFLNREWTNSATANPFISLNLWQTNNLPFQGQSNSQIRDFREIQIPLLYDDSNPVVTDLINPSWSNDAPLTSDRTNIFQFRKDMRNALLDALDSSVRETMIRFWNEISTLSGNNVQNWSPAVFESSERVRLIDSSVKDIMYNIETISNIIGEKEVQLLYSNIYSSLESFRNNLNSFIEISLSGTMINLEKSEELLKRLQEKVNQETLLYHTISLPTVPKNQIKAYLLKSNSNKIWDISDKLIEIGGQLSIDFNQLKNIVGDNKENYNQSWYIKLIPTTTLITTYISDNERTITTKIIEEDVNILGSSLIDKNGKTYKIINKILQNTWVLSESIDNNAIDAPLELIFNYFEPQIIELKFGWMHNYIPKSLPFGIKLPNIKIIENGNIEQSDNILELERVEIGNDSDINKEIW